LGVFGDQLQIAQRGDRGDYEGQQKRNPRCATDFGGHVADKRVNAGTQDVTDDEQQKQAGPHDPAQSRLLPSGLGLDHGSPRERSVATFLPWV
jgi:hypothetical protein